MSKHSGKSPATRLIHPDYRAPEGFRGLSTPVHHASTVLFGSLEDYARRNGLDESQYVYGTVGTPTTYELAHRIAELDGGCNAVLAPSGLAAITLCLLSFLSPGDHLLMTDGAYPPLRSLCEGILKRLGVETTYYDPMAGAAIASLMRPNTRLVWAEAPSSITFEVPDLPALAAAAHAGGALLALDNTWAAGWYLKPFDKGVDVSVQALTKYQGGHGDLLMGAVSARDEAVWRQVRSTALETGVCVGADDAWLVLRGLSTLALRLAHVERTALALAHWLATCPEIRQVLHPALASCPGHVFWQRDFSGSSGLFAVALDPRFGEADVHRMLHGLSVFKLGASWGGPVSLALPYPMPGRRRFPPWTDGGWVVRLSVGLEALEDLRQDLRLGLTRLAG
jgi:cystathionine beta-lyase